MSPILFVIYINDLPNEVKNYIYLFADATKIYNNIGSDLDCSSLQEDMNSLQSWSDTWLRLYHPDICKILRLGNRSDNPYQYSLDGNVLAQTNCEIDLGVTSDLELKFSKHIDDKVDKANSIMDVIGRSF